MIKHKDFKDAIRPLLALAGTDPESVFTEGFEVSSRHVRYLTATEVPGVQPVELGDGQTAAVWAWPVTVEVEQP